MTAVQPDLFGEDTAPAAVSLSLRRRDRHIRAVYDLRGWLEDRPLTVRELEAAEAFLRARWDVSDLAHWPTGEALGREAWRAQDEFLSRTFDLLARFAVETDALRDKVDRLLEDMLAGEPDALIDELRSKCAAVLQDRGKAKLRAELRHILAMLDEDAPPDLAA